MDAFESLGVDSTDPEVQHRIWDSERQHRRAVREAGERASVRWRDALDLLANE